MILTCEHVSRTFHQKKAVDQVSFSIQPGVHALLGANGSGKTTLIRMLAGLLPPSKGQIYFDQIAISKQYDTYCASLGYMPQHFGFYPNYTVEQFLSYMGLLKRMPKTLLQKRIDELCLQLHLSKERKYKMKHLSGGMLRRVGIAQALLTKPALLLLDEPTAGLDPKERIAFRNLIASLANECTVLLSTHIVSDIESIADDILVMKDGSIFAHDTCEALLETIQGKVWEVILSDQETGKQLQNQVIVKTHQQGNQIYLRILADHQPYPHARPVQPDLDDYYLYHFSEEGDRYVETDHQ